MISRIGTLRLDLGEILSYYPTEYAIYKQKWSLAIMWRSSSGEPQISSDTLLIQ